MPTRFLSILLVLCAMSQAASAQDLTKLAVMTLEDRSGELSGTLVDDLTDFLRTQIAHRGTFIVIDKSRQAEALKKMVGDARKESYRACYDEHCQIPLGQALSADTILRVKLTRIGSTYQLTAEVVDLAKEAVDPGMAGSVEIPAEPHSGRDDRLLQGMRQIARQIAGDLPGGAGETITIGDTGDYGITASGGIGAAKGDGIVRFESEPTGAIVEVDGRRLPRVTPVEEFLQLGDHTVKIFGHEGYESVRQTLTLQSGQTFRINLRPVTGSVVVRPRDPDGHLVTGVAVFIDGDEIARAPVRIEGVRAGRRAFQLVKEGMRTVEKTVHISKDGTVDVDVSMVPSAGTIRVHNVRVHDRSNAQDGLVAQVLLDSQPAGETPLELSAAPGDHIVTVLQEMAEAEDYPVTVVDREVVELKPDLHASDTAQWQAFVRKQRTAERTGTFIWLSFLSSSPSRYQMLQFNRTDRIDPTAGKFMRLAQGLTYGMNIEGNYFSLRVFDAVADLSGYHFPEVDGFTAGISPFTNPSVSLTLRPTPLFPLKLEGSVAWYWAWSSDNADVDFSYQQWDIGGHLVYELIQDYFGGYPALEVGVGAQWFTAKGEVTPDLTTGQIEFDASGLLYGGRINYVLKVGKKAALFFGAGAYLGRDENFMALWQIDWRSRM